MQGVDSSVDAGCLPFSARVIILFHLCPGAKVAVLAFSTTDRASFDAIPVWKHKVG